MARVSIPRYAPIMNMVLKYDPVMTGSGWRGDFVAVPSRPDINFAANQDFTIEVWVQPAKVQKYTGNTTVSIVEKWGLNASTPYPYVIRYMSEADRTNPGKVGVARYGPSTANPGIMSKVSINDRRFHYVVFLKSGPTLYLYIDGVLQGATADTTTQTQNESPVYFGKRGHDSVPSYFTGYIGQVRMWNKPLTPTRILEIWENAYPVTGGPKDSRSLASQGLVADWRCDEGYGNTAFDYAGANDGLLGGGINASKPDWTVSTILRQPNFIVDEEPITPFKPMPAGLLSGTAQVRHVTLNELLRKSPADGAEAEAETGVGQKRKAKTTAKAGTRPEAEVKTRPTKAGGGTRRSPSRSKTRSKR